MNYRVLIVDDEEKYRELYSGLLDDAGFKVSLANSAEAAFDIIQANKIDFVLSDVQMGKMSGIDLLVKTRETHPSLPFLLITAYADVKDAVKALKLGAVDYLAKPVDFDDLISAVNSGLNIESSNIKKSLPSDAEVNLIAESKVMTDLLAKAYTVAKSNVNVLLTGESGVGKEVVTDFIHKNSGRKNNNLVALNCAAIPANLLGSELFGHEKGAFSGASASRKGRFREANGGTLFLDEIGDMPMELQPALLRAIELNKISPVGSDKDITIDYRLVAATNKNLLTEVKEGNFRQDLFYRLNVITLEIPPLRERIEDIIPLCKFFLGKGSASEFRFSRAVSEVLENYKWPGNVRELANAMEYVKLFCNTGVVMQEHLPSFLTEQSPVSAPSSANDTQTSPQTLEAKEIEMVKDALKQTGGNRTHAASMLGITRRGLINKIKRYELE